VKRPLTWRRITVAENLALVPREVAAAYRVQVGREQWLFYRSLAAAATARSSATTRSARLPAGGCSPAARRKIWSRSNSSMNAIAR
jgi:hypothetical protein